MSMISLREVTVVFATKAERVVALDRASISVPAGTVATVFGASGSGKSTLVNVAAGLIVPQSGDVETAGVGLNTATEEQRARARLEHIGVVFQESNLIPEFTAIENIILPLRARGMSDREARVVAEEWLERVGLPGLGKRRPAHLSGGQRQRVGIARALAGDRSVLLADEPTGALDDDNSTSVFSLLRRLADDDRAVLIASHDERSLAVSDDVYRMKDGRLELDREGLRV